MMKALKRSSICQLISLLAAVMFIVTSLPVPLFAQGSATVQATTKISLEQIPYFVAGKRIRLAADVTDPAGINLVRCYFKAREQADFVFVSMVAEGNTYTGILPAPAKNASSIEYRLLAVNNKNQVVKTRQFTVNFDADESKPAPPWQDVAMGGQLKVSTELAHAPAVLEGFDDSVAMDVVESAARFGFVAGGIYTVTQIAAAGGVTGAAATAVSAGTVTTTETNDRSNAAADWAGGSNAGGSGSASGGSGSNAGGSGSAAGAGGSTAGASDSTAGAGGSTAGAGDSAAQPPPEPPAARSSAGWVVPVVIVGVVAAAVGIAAAAAGGASTEEAAASTTPSTCSTDTNQVYSCHTGSPELVAFLVRQSCGGCPTGSTESGHDTISAGGPYNICSCN